MERPDSGHLNRKPRGSKRTDSRHPGKEPSSEEGAKVTQTGPRLKGQWGQLELRFQRLWGWDEGTCYVFSRSWAFSVRK